MTPRRRVSKGPKEQKGRRPHAIRRARERYALILTEEVHQELVAIIQAEQGTCLDKQSGRVTAWAITYNEQLLKVCYDKDRKNIITFLPQEAYVEVDRGDDHEGIDSSPDETD